jgi:hypothetical protein
LIFVTGFATRTTVRSTRRSSVLAGRHWEDMNYYADAKSGVITEILLRART